MKKRAVLADCSGMSLIEMMIVIAVLSIVVGAAISFLAFMQRQYLWVNADETMLADMRNVIQHMEVDVRDSVNILAGSGPTLLRLYLPNLNDSGSITGYDTEIYWPDPSNKRQLLYYLVQSPTSRHKGWGMQTFRNYDAARQETLTIFVVLTNLNNGYDTSPQPLFRYSGDTMVTLITEGSVFGVTVTLQTRKMSTPGKFQVKTMTTSIRSRNRY